MTLKQDLDHVTDQYLSEINIILDFVQNTEEGLSSKQKIRPKKTNKDRDIEELKNMIKWIEEDKTKKAKRFLPIESKTLAQSLLQYLIPMTQKKFLTEMTLSYLISYQEAFIKDYLFQILLSNKDMLRSGTKITQEEILDYNSMKALRTALAQREVDSVGYGSIDDTSDYFSKRFNVDLSEFDNWAYLREATYRRNLIVHNRGITNDLYCRKTGFGSKGKHLQTDIDYVVKLAQVLIDFIAHIHLAILNKLKLDKHKN